MPKLPDAAQEVYVTSGLALALIDNTEILLQRDKLRFDLSFERAWRRFPMAHHFPRIARETGADPYWQILDDGSRRMRYLPVAAFYKTPDGWQARLRHDDDTLEECIAELEDRSGVAWEHWQKLGRDFTAFYKQEGSGSV